MNSKKFLYGFCIFYMINLLSYYSVFAKTEACSFSDSEIEGVEISQIGDRQIYTLFTSHLYNEPDTVFAIANFYRPTNAVVLLNQFIERNQEIITSEQSDARKIIELAKSGKVDWIGIERPKTDASYVDTVTDDYLRGRDLINSSFQSLPEWNTNKTTQLLFLLYPAYIIAYANYPEVFRKMRIYPLEDELLIKEFSDRTNNYIYCDKLVKEDHHVTSHQYSSVSSFLNDTTIPRPRLVTESEFENLLNRLEIPEEPPMTRIRMRRLRVAHNDVLSIALKRDVVAVQSILEIPGNGLIIFGTAHGPGIKEGLITACQNGNDSP